jgi:hypothetical protein
VPVDGEQDVHVDAGTLDVGIEVFEEALGVLGRYERVDEERGTVGLEVYAADHLPPLLVVRGPAPEPGCDPVDIHSAVACVSSHEEFAHDPGRPVCDCPLP